MGVFLCVQGEACLQVYQGWQNRGLGCLGCTLGCQREDTTVLCINTKSLPQ